MKVRYSRKDGRPVSVTWKAGKAWVTLPIEQRPGEPMKAAVLRTKSEAMTMRAGGVAPAAAVTFAAWSATWFDRRYLGARGPRVTRERTRAAVLRHLEAARAAAGDVPVHLWTEETVEACLPIAGVDCMPATRNRALVTIRACLEAAVIAGLLRRNPAAAVRKVREVQQLKAAVRPERWLDLLVALQGAPESQRAVALMLFTGLRPAEALGLTWGRVGRSPEGTVELFFSAEQCKEGQAKVVSGPAALVPHLGPAGAAEELVCGGVSQRTVARRLAEACDAIGIRTVTPHGLRHSFAQAAEAAGVPVGVIGRQLGQASITTTERYLRGRAAGSQVRAIQALEDTVQARPTLRLVR